MSKKVSKQRRNNIKLKIFATVLNLAYFGELKTMMFMSVTKKELNILIM